MRRGKDLRQKSNMASAVMKENTLRCQHPLCPGGYASAGLPDDKLAMLRNLDEPRRQLERKAESDPVNAWRRISL